jgi:hypothetical protein
VRQGALHLLKNFFTQAGVITALLNELQLIPIPPIAKDLHENLQSDEGTGTHPVQSSGNVPSLLRLVRQLFSNPSAI